MLSYKDYCDEKTSDELEKLGYPRYHYDATEVDKIFRIISLYAAQKWLREEKEINIFVMQITIEGSSMHRYASYIQLGDKIWLCRYYSLYEEALLEGIKEAVKILKEK